MELHNLCMGCMEEIDETLECPHCGFSEASAPESPYYLSPRTVLQEKYLIGRVLGQGGFAITYLAWDINLGIKLAIKEYFPIDLVYRMPGHNLVMAHSRAQETIFAHDLEKFLQEARIMARFMDHPNIVSVTDFFQANQTAYLVMHYIEGITLRDHLSQSGEIISFDVVMGIMMPVMDALRVVHNAGLLHRDISPENIIISMTGRVMLIDFGAARGSVESINESLSVVMKPGYTPEEQYRTNGIQDARTDIYAVAATIYRAITGQMPPNALDRLENDMLVPPSKLGVEIKPDQEKALIKALSVSANDRFKSVGEFQEALLQRKVAPLKEEKTDSETRSKPKKSEQKKSKPEQKEAATPGEKSVRSYTSLGDINIGRAEDNNLILDDETASRHHARIFSRYGKWYIADLDSTHGTYVNDVRIDEPVELTAPALIRLSESALQYDGRHILNEEGVILSTLNEHVSFTERWLGGDKISASRLIENFLFSLDKITQRDERPDDQLTVNIGRSTDNDLVLEDDMVSRYHASLFYHAGKWYLADLQSTHGTFVNDIPIKEPVKLNPDDKILLSEFPLHFNGGSIVNKEGETLYTLPLVNSEHDKQKTGNIQSASDVFEILNTEHIWVIVSAVVFLLFILFLFIIII